MPDPLTVRCPSIDAAMSARLALSAIADGVVVARTASTGAVEHIAYIVPMAEFDAAAIERSVRAVAPHEPAPTGYVAVSELPLTEKGEIDLAALVALPTLDAAAVERCQAVLAGLPHVRQAAARREARPWPTRHHHLTDVLPDQRIIESPPVAGGPRPVDRLVPAADRERPALSIGAALTSPVPRTLGEMLNQAATAHPGNGVTYVGADGSLSRQTYPQLLADAGRILGGLRAQGIQPGDTVVLQLGQNRDFVPAFWACVLGGAVPVPIAVPPTYRAHNAGAQKLLQGWELLGCPLIVSNAASIAEIEALSTAAWPTTPRLAAVEALRLQPADGAPLPDAQPDDLGLMLLTSGSTGAPKAVMLSHRNVLSRSAATAQMNGFSAHDVALNWFPLDHVGGLVMFHVLACYLGAEQVQVHTDYVLEEPVRWLDLIERHRVTSTWAPNFAFGLICERQAQLGARPRDLSSMRFILNGGEAVVASTTRRFLRLLRPHGLRSDVMHPAWGMSETSSGVTFSHDFAADRDVDEAFVEVGAPIPGVEIRVVDADDQLRQEGEVGRLQVRGLPITSGYFGSPALTAEAFAADGWFNTGDLGVIRGGALTISGRTKDVIIVNGANFSSHELEAVVEEVPGVERSFVAACAVRLRDSQTDRTCIFFSPCSADWGTGLAVVAAIRTALVAALGLTPDFVIPIAKSEVPKTTIGKIQRAQLRARFEAGEFDAVVKRIDLDSGNSRTLPDWFFRPAWVARRLSSSASPTPATFLVFSDTRGLADALRLELGSRVWRWIAVHAGPGFARLDDRRFQIDPTSGSDYRRLIETLAGEGVRVDEVVHLWGYSPDTAAGAAIDSLRQAQFSGCFSVLFLAQALVRHTGSGPKQVTVVTTRSQAVSPDHHVAVEKSTTAGLLKSLALEEPQLRCAHVDFDGVSVTADAQALAGELSAAARFPEVAYRDGCRLESVLTPVDMSSAPAGDTPIVEGGVYLVTGGLGGLGTEVAKHLISRYRAKVLLLGRTLLDSASPRTGAAASRSRRFDELRSGASHASDVRYRAVDLRDGARLRQVIDEAERAWGRQLDGVFHLAGSVGSLERHGEAEDQHWVRHEQIEAFEAMFEAKVYGTQALFACLDRRPDCLVVAFSSVNGRFGGTGYSAYSAANSFLDACCHARRRHAPRTYSINWTMWDDVGMSAGASSFAREASRALGYRILSRTQGLHSLLAALCRQPGQLVIGLDLDNRRMRRHVRQGMHALEQIDGYYETDDATNSSAVVWPSIDDRFGVPIDGVVTYRPADGWRDGMLLDDSSARRGARGAAPAPPRTPTEEQVARLWRDVLAVADVGVHDTFFELGGDSLLAMRLLNRLRETFAVDLSLRTIFERPTIAGLAEVLPAAPVTRPVELSSQLDVSALNDDEVEALLQRLSSN